MPHKIDGVKLAPRAIDDTCSSTIKQIFELYSIGSWTTKELAREFRRKAIKNYKGKLIQLPKQTIHKILTNYFYCGFLKDQDGKLIKAQHDPLVEASLFQRCQTIMLEHSNHNSGKRRSFNPTFPLRNTVYCYLCKQPFKACMSRSQNGVRHGYYYCRSKNCKAYSKAVRKTDLENKFQEYIKQIKPTQKLMEKFKTRFMLCYEEMTKELKTDYSKKMEDIQQMEKDMDYFITRGKSGVLPDHIVQEKVKELDKEINLVKLSLTENHEKDMNINAILSYAETFLDKLDLYWFAIPPEEKVVLQSSIFPVGVNYADGVLSNSKLGPIYEQIYSFASLNTSDVTQGGIEPPVYSLEESRFIR